MVYDGTMYKCLAIMRTSKFVINENGLPIKKWTLFLSAYMAWSHCQMFGVYIWYYAVVKVDVKWLY